jgi:hypothetical protein
MYHMWNETESPNSQSNALPIELTGQFRNLEYKKVAIFYFIQIPSDKFGRSVQIVGYKNCSRQQPSGIWSHGRNILFLGYNYK